MASDSEFHPDSASEPLDGAPGDDAQNGSRRDKVQPEFSSSDLTDISGDAPSSDDQPTVISAQPPIHMSTTSLHREPISRKNNGGASDGLAPGRVLGHFEITEFIGGGGMGRVYAGRDLALGRPVAIKILNRARNSDRETVARFINEAKSAARLNHDNIAHVYFTGEEDGLHYIVFEYVQGMNLRATIEHEGTLPADRALGYAIQIAYALKHASDRGIVHRDIKPSNILITPDDRVKLIDLGLARQLQPTEAEHDLTATGITLGTFDYISPEQARDPRTADTRSDIYSLGCTLFYMLTGRPPFPEGTVLQKLLQHQGDAPPEVREFRPDVPEELARVLRKMLAKDRRHRFQDPANLIDALVEQAEANGLRPMASGNTIWLAPRRRGGSALLRHLPWAASVAALLLGVFLLSLTWDPYNSPSSVGSHPIEFEDPPSVTAPSDPSEPGNEQAPGTGTDALNGSSPATATTSETAIGDGQDTGAGNETAVSYDLVRFPPSTPVSAALASLSLPVEASIAESLSPAPFDSYGLPGAVSFGGESLTLAPMPLAELPSEQPVAKPEASVVVDPLSENPREFASLADALQKAKDAKIIELRFSDARELEPISLSDRTLTIRAGNGYTPSLTFKPSDEDAMSLNTSLLSLGSSDIVLRNISLELVTPRDASDAAWSLIAIDGETQLELDQCRMTIRGSAIASTTAYSAPSSFVSAQRDNDFGVPAEEYFGIAGTAQLFMNDCFLRGEAITVRADAGQPFQWTARNTLFITGQPLIVSDGTATFDDTSAIYAELEHITAFAGSTLFRFNHTAATPYPLPTTIRLECGIVQLRDGALVEHTGMDNLDPNATGFRWEGRQNFYEQVADPWVLYPTDTSETVARVRPHIWKTLWKVQPVFDGGVPWATPIDATNLLHTRLPGDFSFDLSRTDHPVLQATEDGKPAGCDISRLPRFIPPATTPTGGDNGSPPFRDDTSTR